MGAFAEKGEGGGVWCAKRALEGRHRNGRSPRLDWAPPPTRQSCVTTVFLRQRQALPCASWCCLFGVDRLGSPGGGNRQGKRGRGVGGVSQIAVQKVAESGFSHIVEGP